MSTVAAISTPLSASGLGVIRISGEDAVSIGEKCFRPFKGGKALSTLKGYSCAYGRVFDSAATEVRRCSNGCFGRRFLPEQAPQGPANSQKGLFLTES